MIIDAHQHFWNFNPIRDTWIETGTMDKLRQNFLPDDLKPILDKHHVNKTIAVQASQQIEETDFLLDLAKNHSFIEGVVGWADLRSRSIGKQLEKFSNQPKLVGFRHIIQAEPGGFMLDSAFLEGINQLKNYGYVYDILVFAHQLPEVNIFLSKFPDQPFVLDHLAKPNIKDGNFLKWEKDIREAASNYNLYCKVSGIITEAHWSHWRPDDIRPYMDVIFDCFGPDRCMFGSDWPVCLLAGSYSQVLELVQDYVKDFTTEEKEMIFGGTCEKFYKISA
jgi:L-fuconolactonase